QPGDPPRQPSYPGSQPGYPAQQGSVPKSTVAMSSEDAMKALSAAGLAPPPSLAGSQPGGAVGNEITVGRDPAHTIAVENAALAGLHAKIRRNPQGGLVVHGLGSTNGTYLRGERIQQR